MEKARKSLEAKAAKGNQIDFISHAHVFKKTNSKFANAILNEMMKTKLKRNQNEIPNDKCPFINGLFRGIY